MQFHGRTWLTLLACQAVAGAVTAQVIVPPEAGPAGIDAPAPAAPVVLDPPLPIAAPESAPSGLGLNLRGAPIFTSGSIAYDFRATRGHDEPNTVSQLVTAILNARTYIYEPWFATVSGSLQATAGRTHSSGGGSFQNPFSTQDFFGSQDSESSKDRFLTGNARVDVFPRSRFPFEVHVERSDSRIDNTLASSLAFGTQNIGFSQRYRPLSGAYTLAGSYDRREQFGAGFRDKQDVFLGDFATQWRNHELSLGLAFNQARRELTDESTQFRSLVARHRYAPESAVSVDTTVNWSKTAERVDSAPSDLSVVQLSSIGLYHREGAKLTLTGGVRGLLLHDDLTDRALDSLGLTAGASYELNKNARLTANGTATSTTSNGSRAQGFGGTVGASWQSDTIEFRGLRYDWFANVNAGAAVANRSGSDIAILDSIDAVPGRAVPDHETQTSLGTQLGHTLSRSWPMTSQSALTLNFGQTLSVTQNHSSAPELSSIPQSLKTLLHILAATWNVNGDNRSAYARASYNDSLELGGGHARFQLANFQLSGNFELDRNRTLGGDLTLQRVTQRSGDLQSGEFALVPGERTSSTGASGEVTYRQQRLFGIPQLRFTSRIKLAQDVLKQPGTFTTIPDRETRLWENRLDWLVGRLETQLLFRISRIDGRRQDFLMWRVQRNFGD